MTNEFRLGYNRYSNDLSAGNYKWPGLDQFPNINVFDLNAQLGPDGNAPQFGIQNQYQVTDNMSWTKGNHSLKFGFDGWKQISPQSFTQRSRGDYEWSYLSDYLYDYNSGLHRAALSRWRGVLRRPRSSPASMRTTAGRRRRT